VSSAVREGGGTIVEFNGDGMMTVFGAPRALPEKERAALRTARKIVSAVQALEIDSNEGRRLSVGVGIATGQAYVGNIQAVDRFIWSAIGNTTNLAARLQALTRDIGAAIAVDAATFAAAQTECAGFIAHPATSIRGRDEPIDVHALPVADAA
jgi:adenylate cyclase